MNESVVRIVAEFRTDTLRVQTDRDICQMIEVKKK